MKSVNQVELIGFVGSIEPMIILESGTEVLKLSMSTPEKWVDKNTNTPKEATEWHSLVLFGKLAKNAASLLSISDYIRMTGKLKTDKWSDKTTAKKMQKTHIVVNDFILLSSKEDKTKTKVNENGDELFNPNQ